MKSLKFLLVISLFACLPMGRATACGYSAYIPSGYYMYRIYDNKTSVEDDATAMNNCRAWQQLTSEDIPLDDIYYVVYSMSLDSYYDFYNDNISKFYYDNDFALYIKLYDREILDFLLLAKLNEELRKEHISPWYYPSMHVKKYGYTLRDIADKALNTDCPRLRDRLLLQAIRALFTLECYDECIALWNDEASQLSADNPMRRLITPYIAGAKSRMGLYDEAMEFYAMDGDIPSLRMCANMQGYALSMVDAIEMVYRNCPDSQALLRELQSFVRSGERWDDRKYYQRDVSDYVTVEHRRMRELATRLASEPNAKFPAMWYYTAAILYDVDERVEEADRMLKMAERSEGSDLIKESIHVMRIYLDAKTMKYDKAYDKHLYEQLQWLDRKIVENIDSSVMSNTANIGGDLDMCVSYYYWNDMMRRILLAEVCPRMIEAGRGERALQLANMADNYLRSLVGFVSGWLLEYDCLDYDHVYRYPLNEYRINHRLFNAIDYSNNFFNIANSICIDALKRYVGLVERPKSDFDNFLNERSYVNMDYLYDIVGTRLLRNAEYAEAEEWLRRVSYDYNACLNVSLEYNPYEVEPSQCEECAIDFRYRFAQQMAILERLIAATDEPNRRALLMLRYGLGMRNSFGYCWPLTHYGYGNNAVDWRNTDDTKIMRERSIAIIDEALNTFTNDEVAARIHYTFNNFMTVATEYRHTPYGQLVRCSCDRLHDYHSERIICYSK